jgi:hypothetical protein
MFAGIVGLSVALNGAEATEPVLSESTEAEEEVAYNQRLVTE